MKKAMRQFFGMILKPLMNERGAIGEAPAEGEAPAANPLEGTPFKSAEEAAKGYLNLKALHDSQANELGTLRKVVDTLSKQQPTAPPAKAAEPDYDAEIAATNKAIEKLDPMQENYQSELSKLLVKSNSLTAAKVKDTVLNTAGNLFQEELSKRDQKAALDKFYGEYPDFKKPETQAEISNFLANDQTGMHDKFSAFFKIRADKAAQIASQKDAENAEMKRVLDLQRGKDETGKVIVKGQSPQAVTKQPANLAGKDLDAAMAAALAASRGA